MSARVDSSVHSSAVPADLRAPRSNAHQDSAIPVRPGALAAPYSAEYLTGYALAELSQAFDLVRNERDWKAPILAVIPAAAQPVVAKAVLWFTQTPPVFVPVAGEPELLIVRAPGYRVGVPRTRG